FVFERQRRRARFVTEVAGDDDVVVGGDRQLTGVRALDVGVAAAFVFRVDRVRDVERGVFFARTDAVFDVDDAVRGDRARVFDVRRAGAGVRGGVGHHRHRFGAEADPDLAFVAELREGDRVEFAVGRRRGEDAGVGREGAFEVFVGAGAAGAVVVDFRVREPAFRRAADLDRVGGGTAERRAAADHEGVVGVHRAVDEVAGDE